MGLYIITRIQNDENIEIKTIHHKDTGRWRSFEFLLYDWTNPNQVITFGQGGMKILTTPPDFDKVHQNMLECYFVQPSSKGIRDENLITRMKLYDTRVHANLYIPNKGPKEIIFEKNKPNMYKGKFICQT